MLPSLGHIAQALGGEVSGRQVLAPGPGYSRGDRSLCVRFEANAPEGFVVNSFANDDWKLCRDYVRQRLGLPQWEPGDRRDRRIHPSKIRDWTAPPSMPTLKTGRAPQTLLPASRTRW